MSTFINFDILEKAKVLFLRRNNFSKNDNDKSFFSKLILYFLPIGAKVLLSNYY
jgi:hypothetical protein